MSLGFNNHTLGQNYLVQVTACDGQMLVHVSCKCGSSHDNLKFSSERFKAALEKFLAITKQDIFPLVVCRKGKLSWFGSADRVKEKTEIKLLFAEFKSFYHGCDDGCSSDERKEDLFDVFIKDAPAVIFKKNLQDCQKAYSGGAQKKSDQLTSPLQNEQMSEKGSST